MSTGHKLMTDEKSWKIRSPTSLYPENCSNMNLLAWMAKISHRWNPCPHPLRSQKVIFVEKWQICAPANAVHKMEDVEKDDEPMAEDGWWGFVLCENRATSTVAGRFSLSAHFSKMDTRKGPRRPFISIRQAKTRYTPEKQKETVPLDIRRRITTL